MIPLRDVQPSYSKPVVTIFLVVINIMVFLFELSLDSFSRNHFIAAFGLVPETLSSNYLSLVTSMFLHGGWMHLIGNIWFLWIFGDNIEDILGHGKFLLFYLLCGIAAGLAHVLLNMDSRIPTIGASGAIAGVMGGYLSKFPHSRVLTLVPVFLFLTTLEVPAYVLLLYWFVIQFFSGVGSVAYAQQTTGGVAWFAHVGGFAAGFLFVNMLGARQRHQRRPDLYW